MKTVIIEGTLTPSAYLAHGQRATVQLTPEVERKIRYGYVQVVEDDTSVPYQDETPTGALNLDDLMTPPHRGASYDDWVQFLQFFPNHTFDVSTGKRADLISRWDAYLESLSPDPDEQTAEPPHAG